MSAGRSLALLFAPALAACGEAAPICDNKVIREAVSPDGTLKATLFQRDCGPLTGASSQVSILAADETGTARAMPSSPIPPVVSRRLLNGAVRILDWSGHRPLLSR